MLKKAIKLFFLLYVVSLFTIAEHEIYYVFSNILFLFFAGFSMIYILNRGQVLANGVLLCFAMFEIYITCSMTWTVDVSNSIIRISTVFQLLVLLLLIYNVFAENNCKEYLYNCLWIAGGCLCVYFLTQYSVAEILESYNMRCRLGERIAPLNAISRNLAIFIVINVYKILIEKKKKFILPCMIGVILLSTTQSRTGIILCATGVIIIVLKMVKDKRKLLILFLGISILGMAALLKSNLVQEIFWRVGKLFKFLVDTSNSEIDYSAYVRLGLIKTGINLFMDKPFMGWGIASGYTLLGGGYGMYFHNNYVQLLVEVGIIGLTLYYIPIIYVIYKIFKSPCGDYNILAGALLMMIMIGDFMNSTYYHKITYVLIGVALCTYKEIKLQRSKSNENW